MMKRRKQKFHWKQYSYAISYLFFMGIPSAILIWIIHPKIDMFALLFTLLATFLIGGVFDIWGTRQGEKDSFFIWQYNKKQIFGMKLFGVPIEDFVLFLVFTPIFTIVVYEAVRNAQLEHFNIVLTFFIAIALLIFFYRVAYSHSKSR